MSESRPLLACLALLAACDAAPSPPRSPRLRVRDALRGASLADDAGFARADRVRAFEFPADHGPHPEFRSEWWYVTGNLAGADGRRFGFHVTFFRNALAPGAIAAATASPWRTHQLWMAHFALSDVQRGRMHAAERFARGALDLAGARAVPFAVHVEDWSLASLGVDFAPLRLRAKDGAVEVDLELVVERGVVLQGEDGLSRKGEREGNASYYYSVPRLRVTGRVSDLGGDPIEVAGTAWLDREWSTSALDERQLGWDWFALQLDEPASGPLELMLYRLRRDDGSSDPASAGSLVGERLARTPLSLADFSLEALRFATSPRSAAHYPVEWRVRVPAQGLDLRVSPVLDDQELDLAFRYWEGAVDVRGTRNGVPLTGRGYLEMTGYADSER